MTTEATPTRAAWRGLVAAGLALLITSGLLAWRYDQEAERLARFDRYTLPAFDAHVYLAMAEQPAFFTVAPWGYRWLSPAIVHLMPGELSAQSFLGLALVWLAAAGVLLYLFLRRIGATTAGALLGVALFGISEPIRQTFRDPLLAEPLGALLWIGLLLAVESGWLGAAALLLTLGALTKEIFLLFLPGIALMLRPRLGTRRALGMTAALAAPALAATALLRLWWVELPEQASGGFALDQLGPALQSLLQAWPDWWLPVLLSGALPLAVVGALRRGARPLLERYALLAAISLALPFAAASYVGQGGLTALFFSDDVARLLIYALPVVLPLALHGLGLIRDAGVNGPRPRAHAQRWLALAAALVAASPLATLDHYRRADLRGPRDGRRVLAFCRQSLAFARRLERGKLVDYAVHDRRFFVGRSYDHYLELMRWFLLDGWGHAPQYGVGPIEMQEPRATFVLPCFRPEPLLLTLDLGAETQTPVGVEVNGHPVGMLLASPATPRGRFVIPGDVLFRGDNEVALVTKHPGSRVRLGLIRVRPGTEE